MMDIEKKIGQEPTSFPRGLRYPTCPQCGQMYAFGYPPEGAEEVWAEEGIIHWWSCRPPEACPDCEVPLVMRKAKKRTLEELAQSLEVCFKRRDYEAARNIIDLAKRMYPKSDLTPAKEAV